MTTPTSIPLIPPLAGLCDFVAAQRPGMSVAGCVEWLKRNHYVLSQLHGIFTARLTAEPLYELKTAFSHHAYLCAEHVTAIRARVSEMREPPLGLDEVPHPALELLCDEVLCAPTTQTLLIGVYEVLIPELIASFESYLATTNPLVDAPSVRVARFALLELRDMAEFGREALLAVAASDSARRGSPDPAADPTVGLPEQHAASMTDARQEGRPSVQPRAGSGDPRQALPDLAAWRTLLDNCLLAAGGLSGRQPKSLDGRGRPSYELKPYFSAKPFEYDSVPKRDARFQDSYNGGVNPEAFVYDDRFAAKDKVLMLFYKRLREIDVPEMMASIIHQTRDKPWKFYRDMSRQLWDEARHAMLGEVGFVSQGIDWSTIPINFTWSLNLNTQLTPRERHAVLYFIEQGLMPRTGKRYEWEVAQASGLPLATLFQDFDWADEVLHSQIGREWYVPDFDNLKAALDYGDRCWSKVMSHWRQYLEEGKTQHRNWWPDLYQSACSGRGTPPDPTTLAFDETYEDVRADLKSITGSG